MNRRRVSREPKGDEEYEESSVLLWICSSAGENVQREKMKKSSKKIARPTKKVPPLLFF
jgi:hypothetical protein